MPGQLLLRRLACLALSGPVVVVDSAVEGVSPSSSMPEVVLVRAICHEKVDFLERVFGARLFHLDEYGAVGGHLQILAALPRWSWYRLLACHWVGPRVTLVELARLGLLTSASNLHWHLASIAADSNLSLAAGIRILPFAFSSVPVSITSWQT